MLIKECDSKSLTKRIKALDWECENEDTRYLTHGIHRYSGKFIPQIAKNAINLLTEQGETVLDPYCGSGTTLIESALLERASIGLDLNPLAIFIATVKITPVKNDLLNQCANDLQKKIEPLLHLNEESDLFFNSGKNLSLIEKEVKRDERWKDPWFQKWFQPKNLIELIFIYKKIEEIKTESIRNVMFLAFSDILRQSSNAHSSYPNVMFDKNKRVVSPVTPRFLKKLPEILNSVNQLNDAFEGKPIPKIYLADACKMPLEDESVDAVITHPPYIGSIPYAEYGSLSLKWFGHDPKEVDRKLTGGRRQSKSVLEDFKIGFRAMFEESWRVLKKGRYMFMLVGTPTVKGTQVSLSNMAQEFGRETGFVLSVCYHRKGINRRANLMGQEDLLFFQKK